jgi:hypothetical protein
MDLTSSSRGEEFGLGQVHLSAWSCSSGRYSGINEKVPCTRVGHDPRVRAMVVVNPHRNLASSGVDLETSHIEIIDSFDLEEVTILRIASREGGQQLLHAAVQNAA